jgi:hypothetical protein
MIKPDKYTDVGLSVVGVGAEILLQLKKEPSQKYNSLQSKVIFRLGPAAKQNFLLALVFLFSLGKIRYHKKEDAVEYLHTEKQK